MTEEIRRRVTVNGTVQGVGFRPFVYRTAVQYEVSGYVRNAGGVVEIELEGSPSAVDHVIETIQTEYPPLASVDSIQTEQCYPTGSDKFTIRNSDQQFSLNQVPIPPDTAICEDCLADIQNKESPYYNYWATSCVNCGPRFTVIEKMPYDRERTSMKPFPLCDSCHQRYTEPSNRRYHAQTIACPECGPSLHYYEHNTASEYTFATSEDKRDRFPGTPDPKSSGTKAIRDVAQSIRSGSLLAIKGVGGFHLVCDARCSKTVADLREITNRPTKPFAVMVPDTAAARDIAVVSTPERETLQSFQQPIVLLDKDNDSTSTAQNIAPGLHTIGVMLPYSGLHHLLFEHLDFPIVFTSANISGQPTITENSTVVSDLGGGIDGILLHNRSIGARCDDSVIRMHGDRSIQIRRSRGFAPQGLATPASGSVFAAGADRNTVPAILDGSACYLTQHIGSANNLSSRQAYNTAVQHLQSLLDVEQVDAVAYDLHPDFNTTRYAKQQYDEHDYVHVPVQHHHAHAAGVLAEHDKDRAIIIAVDGMGYGPDETIWGGEILETSLTAFDRVGGCYPVPMPGGDRATEVPGRMLIGILSEHPAYDKARIKSVIDQSPVSFPTDDELSVAYRQLVANVNTPITSSAGRVLDAVSALLGCCHQRQYQGEPAMRLEAVAQTGAVHAIDQSTRQYNGRTVIDTPALIDELLSLLSEGVSIADIAATAQYHLAEMFATLAVKAAEERNCSAVGVAGGVAYNEQITNVIERVVSTENFDFIINEDIPPGDGGIAYGQATVAAAKQQNSK